MTANMNNMIVMVHRLAMVFSVYMYQELDILITKGQLPVFLFYKKPFERHYFYCSSTT